MNRMASGAQPRAKVQHRHAASIEIRPHSETDSTTLGPQTRTNVQHLSTASGEPRTKSTSTALNITPKPRQQYGLPAKYGTNSMSTGLNITPKFHQQHGSPAKAGTNGRAKAGIDAVQWLQMLYVNSSHKIE